MMLLILLVFLLPSLYSACTLPPVISPALYLDVSAVNNGNCIPVDATFLLVNFSAGISSTDGPICVGPPGSSVTWKAPPNGVVATDAAAATLPYSCGVFVLSLQPSSAELKSSGTICPNGAVFTCVITKQDGSTSELYVGANLPSTWPSTIAASHVTWSAAPPSFILNCTTSALGVVWTVDGSPVAGNSYDARSKLLSAMGPYNNIAISYTLNVTAALFGNYSCTANTTFGSTSASVLVSPADIAPGVPRDVVVSEVGPTNVAILWSQPPQPPLTLFYNITYVGGCAPQSRALVTVGSNSAVNITGLQEGSMYNVTIYGLGIFNISGPQTFILAQTNPAVPSRWPSALQEVGHTSTTISLSWLVLSCEGWRGLSRSYVVLCSPGGGANVTITTNTLNVTIGNLKPNTVYWFRVAAVNEAGTGPYSPAINVTITQSVPDNILIIVLAVVGGTCLLAVCMILLVVTCVCRRCVKKEAMHVEGFELPVVSNQYAQAGRPPVIEGFPDSCTAVEGGHVVFEGVVTGWPPPTCQWSCNGVSLQSKELAHIGEGGKVSLPVAESGMYLFAAVNHLGTAEKTIKVTVTSDSDDDDEDGGGGDGKKDSPSISSEKSGSMRPEKPVPVDQLKDYVVQLLTNNSDGFHCQYKCLPSCAEKASTVAQQNRQLNRLPKIVPYDDNRVILHPMLGSNDTCNEYINASYINGHDHSKKFIATQGPLQNTLVDFWWMVWQEEVGVIVMLCDLVERGKVVCQQYWPEESGLTYGPFLVTLMGRQETHPHYIIHNIQLQLVGGGSRPAHQIRHYKFTSWPEHGVPENAGPLLALRQGVMEEQTKGPIVVHCNGIGRTGVFIALDCALEQARSEDCVDVMAIVTNLREQRMKLVQSEAQYIFIYNSLLEELACGCTRIPVRNLRSYLSTNADSIEAQYELLLKITPRPVDVDRTTALSNPDRNRSSLFLPWEKRRVVLDGIRPDYIHASYVDGYEKRKAFIVAEGPMENTCDQFWHMVYQEQCGLIVMLSHLKEHGQETCHRYWPSEGEGYFNGLTVKLEQQSKTDSQHERRFTVFRTLDQKEKLKVTHIQVLNWMADGQCANYDALARMVEKVGKSTVIVHCSDTVSRSGIFCALTNVVEQAKMEGIADIFQAVKRLRIQKPGAVQLLSQYRLIYELLRCYWALFDSYNN